MNKLQFAGLCFSLALVALIATGCGSGGSDLTGVQGTVTLDGAPLQDASVTFQPVQVGGSPSSGTTDADGHYELYFTFSEPGCQEGKHNVTITVGAAAGDDDDDDDDDGDDEDEEPLEQFTTPAEVVAGKNVIDFALPL